MMNIQTYDSSRRLPQVLTAGKPMDLRRFVIEGHESVVPEIRFIIGVEIKSMLPPRMTFQTQAVPSLSSEQLLQHIVVQPDVCVGQPCIRGTRTPIWILLGELADGDTPEQVVQNRPYLTVTDVRAALLYAAHQLMPKDEADGL